MLWGISISYGGFPYNMGDSHVIWVFPAAGNNGNNGINGNNGNNGNTGNKDEKKISKMKFLFKKKN